MDQLSGGTSATLAKTDDLRVVSWHADLIRDVVRPLMSNSFTRRVAVWAYEVLSPHPKLPRNLGTRPSPEYSPIDPLRYRPYSAHAIAGGGARPDVLRDTQTSDLYIFKGEDTAVLTFASHGIDGVTQPIRSRAAALVATALGVPTPDVRLVEYAGTRGSFQKIVANTTDLSRLYRRAHAQFNTFVGSTGFAMERSDIWILDRVIGNLDRQSHNMLVRQSESGLGLIAIDHDLSFAPVRRARPIFGIRDYTPRRVRRQTYDRLYKMGQDRTILTTLLAPLLTEPELMAVFARLDDTIATIDKTVNRRGEEAVFFPA